MFSQEFFIKFGTKITSVGQLQYSQKKAQENLKRLNEMYPRITKYVEEYKEQE